MHFPLEPRFLAEADDHALRAGCHHCFHRLGDGRCGNGWPAEGQERWPLGSPDAAGRLPHEVVFCREFELA